MHAGAFFASLPAGLILVLVSEQATARVAAAIYAVSLALMFGTSAAYHRLARSDVARRRMQRLDHAGIYLLIAGTYVPVSIVIMPLSWGIPLMSVVGATAVLGIVLKLAAFHRITWLGYSLYPVMGWTAVVAAPILIERLSLLQLVLIIGGGVVYTLGIPILFLKRPDPWPRTFGYHEVWHCFVVVAAGLHFAAVATILA